MSTEKYLIATTNNSVQIKARNILNPQGYIFLNSCQDANSLIRMIRVSRPDFVIIDNSIRLIEINTIIRAIEDTFLCSYILLVDNMDENINNFMDTSKGLVVCPKDIINDVLIYSVRMSLIFFKKISEAYKDLNKISKNYETAKIVERAKGILMERENIDENDAYTKMRKKSMDTRMSMKTLAEAILLSREFSNDIKKQ